MPVRYTKYKAPMWLFHPHMETIFPAVMRTVVFNQYERERINTPDDDFLELDWSKNGSDKLIILCHGLEGNSKRPYMKGMAKIFYNAGYDVLSWSYRGCGDEMNSRSRYYHSGATDDLDTVVQHAREKGDYKSVGLIGFSLGGNIVLKYAGEPWKSRVIVNSVIAISVPVHLESSSREIGKRVNWVYNNRFLASLESKVKLKEKLYPGLASSEALSDIKTLRQFDDIYTSKLHGFEDAADYYQKCSSLFFLESIEINTAIINARNDTFLSALCFPEEQVKKNNKIELIITNRGGHVGYSSFSGWGIYWSESTALSFMNEKMS